jgi:hypothetical protein
MITVAVAGFFILVAIVAASTASVTLGLLHTTLAGGCTAAARNHRTLLGKILSFLRTLGTTLQFWLNLAIVTHKSIIISERTQ